MLLAARSSGDGGLGAPADRPLSQRLTDPDARRYTVVRMHPRDSGVPTVHLGGRVLRSTGGRLLRAIFARVVPRRLLGSRGSHLSNCRRGVDSRKATGSYIYRGNVSP